MNPRTAMSTQEPKKSAPRPIRAPFAEPKIDPPAAPPPATSRPCELPGPRRELKLARAVGHPHHGFCWEPVGAWSEGKAKEDRNPSRLFFGGGGGKWMVSPTYCSTPQKRPLPTHPLPGFRVPAPPCATVGTGAPHMDTIFRHPSFRLLLSAPANSFKCSRQFGLSRVAL